MGGLNQAHRARAFRRKGNIAGHVSLAAASLLAAGLLQVCPGADQQKTPDEAAASFAEAASAFASRPADRDWAAWARGDGAEMLLRLGKWKEAADAAGALLKDPATKPGPCRDLALYHLGYALFNLDEHLEAGRALSQLAPFPQEFGAHARYLLGRIHHLAGERAEAAIQYRGARTGHVERVRSAQQAMRTPNALTSEKRAACEALLRDPPPEYVSRAAFYLAMTDCETDRYPEAIEEFAAFIQRNPHSPLAPEALLRQAFCRLQSNAAGEALPQLQKLAADQPRSDRARWWLARCQARLADPRNPEAYDELMKSAAGNLRAAAELAGQLSATDPAAKIRRGDVLMELGDLLMKLNRWREAADAYRRVARENTTPNRVEEATQRCIAALHLGGFYRESEELGARFEQEFPRSVLLPAALLRRAGNAYMTAMGQAASAAPAELARLFAEPAARYRRIIEQFPDFTGAGLAREGLASCCYRLGKYEDAIPILESIPKEDCYGELANVPYLLADCLIRTSPPDAADAWSAADLMDKAERAAALLEVFVAANEKSPMAPDAFLKLGWCYGRVAGIAADTEARSKALAGGQSAYERLIQKFPQDPQAPAAILGRASCIAALAGAAKDHWQQQRLMSDAVTELGKFLTDTRGSAAAPDALLKLAAMLRAQDRGAEAADAVQQYRAQFGPGMLKDPAAADKLCRLMYEQALSLKKAGKTAEARALLEGAAKAFPAHPMGAAAAWRAAQDRREELTSQAASRMEALRNALARTDTGPEDLAAAERKVNDLADGLRGTLTATLARADGLRGSAPGSHAYQGALHEAGSVARLLADAEIEAAVRQMRRDSASNMLARLLKSVPAGQTPPAVREPSIRPTDAPQPQAERTAVECFERIVAAAPDTALAAQARVDLAELLIRRSRHDAALQALGEALNRNPQPEIARQARAQLAAAWLGREDATAGFARTALTHAEAVAADAGGPPAPYARCLAGEALVRMRDWSRAIERLTPFRDQAPLQSIPDVSDRALLLLGRAYLENAQWDACRQALEILRNRFPRSPWYDESLNVSALSAQRQEWYDGAAGAYQMLAGQIASDQGAEARVQMGLCRIAQRRFPEAVRILRSVTTDCDLPEWQAPDWFAAVNPQNPKPPYLAEEELRRTCFVLQSTNFAASAPAAADQPPNVDRALWLIGRCQAGQADPRNARIFSPVMSAAIANLRRAADLAGKTAQTDPEAKIRRGDILMDLAEALAATGQYKEAAGTYQQIVQENAAPNRSDDAALRRILALYLAGADKEADDLAAQFEQTYPRSPLVPAALFRRAEAAYQAASTRSAGAREPAAPDKDAAALFSEAAARYQSVVARFPDFADMNALRGSLGACHYRLGNYAEAIAVLNAIPPESRGGDLAEIPCLLADCLIRSAPPDAQDAAAAAAWCSRAQWAASLLAAYVGANERNPAAKFPDALYKLGWCLSRVAETTTDSNQRNSALQNARGTFDRLIRDFPQDPSIPAAIFERAGCLASLGDAANAVHELGRFRQNARGSAVAPEALMRLAGLLRAQNRPDEAAGAVREYLTRYEADLLRNPDTADKVPHLQYEQALSLRMANRQADARRVFEKIVKTYPTHPAAADAAWHAGQYRLDELACRITNRVDTLQKAVSWPDTPPEELASARRAFVETTNNLRSALNAALAQADAQGKTAPGSAAHAAALYEAAIAGRFLADQEIEDAMRRMRQDAVARMRARMPQPQAPAGQPSPPPPEIREPVVPLAEVAPPPSEQTAVDCYERLVAAAPDTPLAARARVELAGLHARRGRYDSAIALLADALDREMPPELVPQARVQLAAACLEALESNAALPRNAMIDVVTTQAATVAANTLDPRAAARARYVLGGCLAAQKEWSKAIEQLTPFRNDWQLQSRSDVTDLALLVLGQAYMETSQWDQCRQALSMLRDRYPRSVLGDEAAYTIGASWEKQGQHAQAADAYQWLAGKTPSEWGAKAQLRVGLCRLAQKRLPDALQALTAVAAVYDFPEWTAQACVEAARVHMEMKQPDEAGRLLQKVIAEYPDSPWAQKAREQLNELGAPQAGG